MSIYKTQEAVTKLQHRITETEMLLARLKRRLDTLIAAHRAQIQKSLSSPIPQEREAAERVAAWWDVSPPSS